MPPPDRRRWPVSGVIGILVVAGALFFYFFACHGAEKVLSKFLSATLGTPVTLQSARPVAWNQVNFTQMEIKGPGSEHWLKARSGSVRALPHRGAPFSLELDLLETEIKPVFFSGWIRESKLLGVIPLDRELAIRRCALRVFREGTAKDLRLVSLEGEDLFAQGGLRWVSGSLDSAHLMLKISGPLADRIPLKWRKRFPIDAEGRSLIKFSFRNGSFTLFGDTGRIFSASWQIPTAKKNSL